MTNLRRVKRKTLLAYAKKGADQLCSNYTAEQRLGSRYIDSTIPSEISKSLAIFYSCVGPGRQSRRQVFSRRSSSKRHTMTVSIVVNISKIE